MPAEQTVRLRPGDLPVRLLPNAVIGNGAKTTRLRAANLRLKTLPNPATVTITLVGHLIFGLVLGLAFLKAPRGRDLAIGLGFRSWNLRWSSACG